MAEYIFKRGKFGRWNTPMWAGETQAFKLIRLLRKQGVKKIIYEEGPTEPVTFHRKEWYAKYKAKPFIETDRWGGVVSRIDAPKWFKVRF